MQRRFEPARYPGGRSGRERSVDIGTKQYVYGAGGGAFAGLMVGAQGALGRGNDVGTLKGVGVVAAGGIVGGLVTAALQPDDQHNGSGLALVSGLASGAAVGVATASALHVGSTKLNLLL